MPDDLTAFADLLCAAGYIVHVARPQLAVWHHGVWRVLQPATITFLRALPPSAALAEVRTLLTGPSRL